MDEVNIPLKTKISLAKRARKMNAQQREQLCKNEALDEETLLFLVDAYIAGGQAGLEALETPQELPADEASRAVSVIKIYLEYRFQNVRFDVKQRKNCIMINQIVSSSDVEMTDRFHPIAKICYYRTQAGKTIWLIYYHRTSAEKHRWWPYITRKQRCYKIDQVMEEMVSEDADIFWKNMERE